MRASLPDQLSEQLGEGFGVKADWGKILSSGLLGVLFCLGGAPQVSSDPVQRPNPLEVIAQAYPTPDQLALFLRKNIVFENDLQLFGQVDYWQLPEEFLARGRGDCEDYALLAQDLLSRQGIEAFVFSLYGEGGYAHTVCVFVEEGRYNVMNQDHLIRLQAGSLKELADRLYPRWSWGAVAERRGHRGQAIRVIHRAASEGLIHAGFGDKIRSYLPDVKVANPANRMKGGVR